MKQTSSRATKRFIFALRKYLSTEGVSFRTLITLPMEVLQSYRGLSKEQQAGIASLYRSCNLKELPELEMAQEMAKGVEF